MDMLANMKNRDNNQSQTGLEDWPLSNRKPICGEVEIPKSLKDKVRSVMYRNKLKMNDSQASLTYNPDFDTQRQYAKSTL